MQSVLKICEDGSSLSMGEPIEYLDVLGSVSDAGSL